MTTKQQRIEEIYEAYRLAKTESARDKVEATTIAQIEKINANLDNLERAYLRAGKLDLERNNPDIEAAYQAAKQARSDAIDAYEGAKSLPERIKLVSKLATEVASLITALK